MKFQFSLTIISFLLFTEVTLSQNYYRLTNGPVLISGIYNDSLIIAESNSLYFIFDYQTNEVNFNLPVKSLKSNNYHIDSLIKKEFKKEITFKGKIIGEYDATKEHPPLFVVLEGDLEYDNYVIPLSFNATITHLKSGSASCNFSATINMDITKYFDEMEKKGIEKSINIIFNELILYKIN